MAILCIINQVFADKARLRETVNKQSSFKFLKDIA